MSLLAVGSVALDSVETPFGKMDNILGGSAVYFSISASFFTKVNIVGVIGKDFPKRYIALLKQRGVGLKGVEVRPGSTFRWKGSYSYDLNTADTIYTKLNVFSSFMPKIPNLYKRTPFLFLGNIDPNLQQVVLKKVCPPKLVACDTMNFWIKNELKALKRLLKQIDIFIINDSEARLLSQENNLIKAARSIFSRGPKKIVIKRGDSGAIFFTKNGAHFNTPAYLMENVKDPTGAGDSFAGGFMGCLSKENQFTDAAFRRAVIYGTMMASFCVQDFGPKQLLRLKPGDIEKRFKDFKRLTCF